MGSTAIAEVLGLRPNQVVYLTKIGELPTFRIGKRICATRGLLAAWVAKNQAAVAAV